MRHFPFSIFIYALANLVCLELLLVISNILIALEVRSLADCGFSNHSNMIAYILIASSIGLVLVSGQGYAPAPAAAAPPQPPAPPQASPPLGYVIFFKLSLSN